MCRRGSAYDILGNVVSHIPGNIWSILMHQGGGMLLQGEKEVAVAVRCKSILATAFHPELTEDVRW